MPAASATAALTGRNESTSRRSSWPEAQFAADPTEEKSLCVHGNPNVLTRDIGTSALAQGCTGQLTTVQVERFDGNLPPIQAYEPPESN